jgi:hypothetical protein
MKRNLVLIQMIIILVTLLIVLAFFLLDDSKTLTNLDKVMGSILTPLVALVGISVSISINNNAQKNIARQEMLQKPLVYLRCLDYDDKIELNLQNKGLGPLIIKSYKIINFSEKKEYVGIFECLHGINGAYDNFTGNQDGLVLSANEQKNLFKLKKSNENFTHLRKEVRNRFSKLGFEIEYTDIYNNRNTNLYKKA